MLYKPAQNKDLKNINLVYLEKEPLGVLKKYIRCYWELSTREKLERNFIYNIIPDGCIDVLWSIENQKDIFLSGFSTTYTSFPLSTDFKYFGIRFLPTAFPLLNQINADKLISEFLLLKEPLAQFSEDLRVLTLGKTNLNEISLVLNDYFLDRFNRVNSIFDSRMASAVEKIYLHKGLLSVESDIDTGLSIRQLRRLFKYYIGTSPKAFSQIVKFQAVYQMFETERQLFYQLAYFDQAHFIKSFKKMTGFTPHQK